MEDKLLSFEDRKKDRNEYSLYTHFPENCISKNINGLENDKNKDENDDLEGIKDDSLQISLNYNLGIR